MLKNLCLCVLLSFSHSLVAQQVDFAPVGAKWWVNHIVFDTFGLPSDSFMIVEVTGEEVFAGELCRVITNLSGCGLPDPAYVFTRNDSVFFYSEVSEQFQLLYDFTAVAGSTWTVEGLTGLEIGSHTVVVESVTEFDYNGDTLKTWLTTPFTEYWGDRIVEKAGSLWYPGPTFTNCPIDDPETYGPFGVRCYEEDGELYRFVIIDCEAVIGFASVDDGHPGMQVDLHPNPVSDVLHLTFSDDSSVRQYIITDTQGRTVLKGDLVNGEVAGIFTGDLAAGLYFVRVYAQGLPVAVGRFVKVE